MNDFLWIIGPSVKALGFSFSVLYFLGREVTAQILISEEGLLFYSVFNSIANGRMVILVATAKIEN